MGSKVSWLIFFSLLCAAGKCPAAGQEKSEGLEIKLLVNQAGYDLLSPKRVLLQTNFPPDSITEYEVVNNDRVHCRGKWGKPQKIEAWELWYREALLPISAPGRFFVRIHGPEKKVDSPPFAVQKDRLFEHTAPLATYFFYAQRCGVEVPGWHAACHLDDGCLPDGSHLDLVGGWHDGGDYNKYNGYTPLAVYALARLAQSPGLPVAFWGKSVPTPEEEALWGARWLIKCQDEKTGKIIGRVFSGFEYWGPPEFETDNWPGNADDRKVDVFEWNENEMTVAAWASVYQITGDPFWMNRALNLWKVVSARRFVPSLVQGAKRLIAAAELYRITGDFQFFEAGLKESVFLLSGQESDGSWPLWPLAIVDYGLPTAALAQFLLAFPPNPLSPSVQTALVRAVESWSSKMVKAFFIPKWSSVDIFYPFQPMVCGSELALFVASLGGFARQQSHPRGSSSPPNLGGRMSRLGFRGQSFRNLHAGRGRKCPS